MAGTLLKRSLLGLVVMIAAGGAAQVLAASNIYLELEVDGNFIEGDVTAPDFNQQLEVKEFHHLMRDSGKGGAEHKEAVFTMELGKGTTKIIEAWATIAPLTKCIFSFLRLAPGGGGEEVFLTIELQGGYVAAVEPISIGQTELGQVSIDSDDLVRVRIVYGEMTVTDPAAAWTLVNPAFP